MRISSPRLRRLDEALAGLPAESDAMLLSELDGYLAGVIVCPELILPSAWMPLVWSSDGDGTPFEDEREAQWYIGLVMEHYNAVVRGLSDRPNRYAPFLEHDARHDEILWELWVEGFEAAMKLAPDSWGRIVESGAEKSAAALAGMITLAEIARDESDLSREAIDRLTDEAPNLIARWIPELNGWRLKHGNPTDPAARRPSAKVGRNDPCPCGSGRKYKRCCGSN